MKQLKTALARLALKAEGLVSKLIHLFPFKKSYTVGPIQYRFLHFRANLQTLGLAPGRTSDVGQGQSQGKFFLVGQSDSGRRKKVFTSL